MYNLFDELFRTTWNYPTVTRGKFYTDDGEKVCYYQNNMLHRSDGPAVEYRDGKVEYWLNGKQVDKEAVDKLAEEKENNREVIVTIDGKTYVITGKQLKELNLHDTLLAAQNE